MTTSKVSIYMYKTSYYRIIITKVNLCLLSFTYMHAYMYYVRC